MQADASQVAVQNGSKVRLMTVDRLDGRTTAARHVHSLMRSYQRLLARKPTHIEAAAIQRTAMLQAIAEDCRVRLLRGDPHVSHEDVSRADNCARRAARDLSVLIDAKPKRREPDDLEAIYARLAK